MPRPKKTSPPPARPNAPKPGWQAVFLAELRKWGVAMHAAGVAEISIRHAYRIREQDPEFAAEWDEAVKTIVSTMEVVARQRALVGVRTPVIFQGKVVDHIQEVDSGMLRWLLSRLKPEVYGDKVDHTLKHSGAVAVNVSGQIDVRTLTNEQLYTLRDILGSATAIGGSADRASEEELI